MNRYPWFKFYPSDWMRDAGLARCSPATRGFWIDMLCLMYESEEPGVLRGWTVEQIANAMRGQRHTERHTESHTESHVSVTLAELERNGVVSKFPDGSYYNRRMVRDEKARSDHRARQDTYRHLHNPTAGADVTPDVTHKVTHKVTQSVTPKKSEVRTAHNNTFISSNTKRGWIDPDEERRRKTNEAIDTAFRNREARRNIPPKSGKP